MTQSCTTCGADLTPGAPFCQGCGTAVSTADTSAATASDPESAQSTVDGLPPVDPNTVPPPPRMQASMPGGDSPHQDDRGVSRRMVLFGGIGVGVIVLGLVVGLVLALTGGSDDGDVAAAPTTESEAARQAEEDARQAEEEAQRLAEEVEALKEDQAREDQAREDAADETPAPTSPPPADRAVVRGEIQCDPGLTVNTRTSCPFARNVRDQYNAQGGGSAVVVAFSPATGRDFEMSCISGVPVVCTGGDNAAVYIG